MSHVHSPLHQLAPFPWGQSMQNVALCPPQLTSDSKICKGMLGKKTTKVFISQLNSNHVNTPNDDNQRDKA